MSQENNCLQLVGCILEQINDLPSGPFWITDLRNKKYRLPVRLGVGNGRYIHINPEIGGLLVQLSKSILLERFGQFERDFTFPEWRDMTKRVFGEVYGNAIIDSDQRSVSDKRAKEILEAVDGKMRDWIDQIQDREYVFGCDFCNIQSLKPLVIGAVRFEPRDAWLERIHAEGNISKVAFSRIQRIWEGEALRKRKFSEDQAKEENIIVVIGKCEFACSVRISKAGTEAGLQRALTAARLATTVIALSWQSPSYALEKIGLAYDRTAYLQNHLSFSSGDYFAGGSKLTHIQGGFTALKKEEWEQIAIDLETIYSCAGEVITYVARGQNSVTRPKVMDVFFQALLWFHEGCREKVGAMAIVKFCAVLEALAVRKKQGKRRIIELVKARLDIRDKNQFDRMLERIYGDGRSKTVHGTNNELWHDWSDERKHAEELCRLCLLSCLNFASENSTLEDPSKLSTNDK